MDLFSHIKGSKAFLPRLPLKNGLQSSKPAISPIIGVISKKKGLQSWKPPNSTFFEMISKKVNRKKGLLTSQIVGIDKRSDLEKYFCLFARKITNTLRHT